jgi:hypothetical protein
MKGLGLKLFAGFGVFLIVLAVLAVFWGVGVSNKEVGLRNKIAEQQEVMALNFDKMWKVISQQAQVKGEYKKDFKDVYNAIMEGRYNDANRGQFMAWIKEHNPQFDSTLYTKLMTSIEANRTEFFMEQKKLRSFKKEHDDIIKKFPSSLIVGSRGTIDCKFISSAATKAALETGEENDVQLFK